MNAYNEIFDWFDLPYGLRQCVIGQLKLPLATFEAPAKWFGFPPALIPLWSDGSGPTYIGIWRHWFAEREPTYVKMYVGSGRMTVEIARTAEQLLALVAVMAISERDGVENDLINFANNVHLLNLEEIDNVTLASGDDAPGLIRIDQFKTKTPVESLSFDLPYSGCFPNADFKNFSSWQESSCSFEISEAILENWPANALRPIWICNSEKNLCELFYKLLGANDLRRAWFVLNSSGWNIRDARGALSALAKRAQDNKFCSLVDAWLSISNDSVGGY